MRSASSAITGVTAMLRGGQTRSAERKKTVGEISKGADASSAAVADVWSKTCSRLRRSTLALMDSLESQPVW